MLKTSTKKRLALGLAFTATLGTTMTGGSASADPANQTAFVGVGSDTTQDVLNALTGRSNGILYTPIQSTAATGATQIISYDATNPDPAGDSCIVTKRGFGAIYRPNGSSEGRRMLSRSLDGTTYGKTGVCGGFKDPSGMVDFARSSAGPSTTHANDKLTYLPFAKDAVSFAYYKPGGGVAVTNLTATDLTAIYGSSTRTSIDPDGAGAAPAVTIVPCGIQAGSGTFNFWNQATGASATEATATSQCNSLALAAGLGTTTAGRAQENDGPALSARGDVLAANAAFTGQNIQVIIGFSAGSYISKSNGVAFPHPKAGADQLFGGANAADDRQVGIGSIAGVSPVVDVNATPLVPNSTFYASSTYGRKIYNVLSTDRLAGFGDADLKNLFVGNTSQICQATSTVQTFGFLSLGTGCGAVELGDLVTGNT